MKEGRIKYLMDQIGMSDNILVYKAMHQLQNEIHQKYEKRIVDLIAEKRKEEKEVAKSTSKAILKILEHADSFEEVIDKVFEIMSSYGPRIKFLLDAISNYIIENTARSVEKYQNEYGFSRKEAILFTLNNKQSVINFFEGIQKRK